MITKNYMFATEPEHIQKAWALYTETRDLTARNCLTQHYLPTVRTEAARMMKKLKGRVEFDDLFSVGALGLMTALKQFDANRGVSFKTYSAHRIRGMILDEIRRLDWVPRLARCRTRALRETTSKLEQELGRKPSEYEIAEAMALSVEQLHDMRRNSAPVAIVPASVVLAEENDEQDSPAGIQAVPDPKLCDPAEHASQSDLLLAVQFDMSTAERFIIKHHYIEGRDLKYIAERVGVTESRISQIHLRMKSRLRYRVTNDIFRRIGGHGTPKNVSAFRFRRAA